MGDYVEVRRAEVKPARRLVLAPAHKNLRLSGSGEALRRTLYQRPLVAGDVLSTSVYRRPPTAERGLFPEDIFRMFFEQPAYGLQEIRRLYVPSGRPAHKRWLKSLDCSWPPLG
jgi:transitional endoplasmic reticulum ATPase